MQDVGNADLRYGKWQDVLADVTCDALIVDAPYSERTHSGHRDGVDGVDGVERKSISYTAMSSEDVHEFCVSWAPRTNGWLLSITDHVLAPEWTSALEDAGRYVFAPIPVVETGSRVRLAGDGPSSWTCWLIASRPKRMPYAKWGTLRGAYVAPNERKPVIGGKPLGIMRAIVRDYTRPGDLVCDPCAGGGTTLLAALTEGRRAVGSEMDPKHFEIARKRLARGYTPPLFVDGKKDDAA